MYTPIEAAINKSPVAPATDCLDEWGFPLEPGTEAVDWYTPTQERLLRLVGRIRRREERRRRRENQSQTEQATEAEATTDTTDV